MMRLIGVKSMEYETKSQKSSSFSCDGEYK